MGEEKEKRKPIANVRLKARKGIIDISFWEGQRFALVKVDEIIKTGDQSVNFSTVFKGRVDVLDLMRFWIDLGKVLKEVGEQWFIDFKRVVEKIEEITEVKEEE